MDLFIFISIFMLCICIEYGVWSYGVCKKFKGERERKNKQDPSRRVELGNIF